MREETQSYTGGGKNESYRQLYIHYYHKLYNYGKKFTADITLIEDSIQDIFLDYWKKRDLSVHSGALNSYLFAAFRYSLFYKIARQKKQVALLAVPEEPDFSTDHFIMARELTLETEQNIRAALRQLTSRQREALFLRFYEGLSYEEIAAIMNISVKASYKLMARSLLQLKKSFSLSLLLFLLRDLTTAQKYF